MINTAMVYHVLILIFSLRLNTISYIYGHLYFSVSCLFMSRVHIFYWVHLPCWIVSSFYVQENILSYVLTIFSPFCLLILIMGFLKEFNTKASYRSVKFLDNQIFIMVFGAGFYIINKEFIRVSYVVNNTTHGYTHLERWMRHKPGPCHQRIYNLPV